MYLTYQHASPTYLSTTGASDARNVRPNLSTTTTAAREHLEEFVGPMVLLPALRHSRGTLHLEGKSHPPRRYKCKECREHFTVTVGTVFERSKIPLSKWLFAAHLCAVEERHVRAPAPPHVRRDLQDRLVHGAPHARSDERAVNPGPLGGGGKTVEADEPTSAARQGRKSAAGRGHKHAVVGLVERGGKARIFHVERVERRQRAKGAVDSS